MKFLFSLLVLTSLVSCSRLKNEAPKEPEKAISIAPAYTGKWVAKGEGGPLWYLSIYEETYENPEKPHYMNEGSYSEVVALLKMVPKTPDKDFGEVIYRFSGSRVTENAVFLGGPNSYELGIPTRTWVFKFKIPKDLEDGFTAWLEDSRTGGMIDKIPEDRHHDFIKLKFKRLEE